MMQVPPCPLNEAYRLEALSSLQLLDTAPDPQFDRLVRLGQKLFGVEICLITLVDSERQWFKARVGLDIPETSRDISFCGHAIIDDDVFVVRNALEDERFHDNPLVTGPPAIRFYAGAPLRLPTGYNIGTLCIISTSPHPQFGRDEEELLRDLASIAVGTMALGALRESRDRLLEVHEDYLVLSQISSAPMAILKQDGIVETCNSAFSKFCTADPATGHNVATFLELKQDWQQELVGLKELVASFRASANQSVRLFPIRKGYLVVG